MFSIPDLPKIIGHRGSSIDMPENTEISFRRASELGAKWIECDLQLTADHKVVIIHDNTIDRTSTGSGKVANMSLEELKNYRYGNGESILTLEELIVILGECNLGANLELKANPATREIFVERVLSIIDDSWPLNCPHPLLSSDSVPCLKALRDAGSNYPVGLISHFWPFDCIEQLQNLGCVSLHLNYKEATPYRVQAVKQAGFSLLCYTVNKCEVAEKLLKDGVDSIFTDDITVMKAYMD